MIYYEFTPIDTLFFRGAIPLEAGLPVSETLFPPPVSVFAGAVRTASGPEFWNDPVEIPAVLLKKGPTYYAQAPYSWFVEKEKSGCGDVKKTIIPARDNSAEFEAAGILASAWPLPWIDNTNAKSIGGSWIDVNLFTKGRDIQLQEESLFNTEDRVGVALGPHTRTAVEGRLYTTRHVRLRDGVNIVIALDNAVGLKEQGVLQLGGEGRRCAYQKIEGPHLNWNVKSDRYVALASIPCTAELLSKTFCAKTFVSAGWDLAKNYHKTSETWFYAGSVFNENINNQCAPLAL
ncbi:MAG: hypothetical protein LBB80_09875 [Treponema sp.]|jgi:CRISPR-associated protein Cmr3|nr:hypothetical protein [Treponema sp.]